jgi:gluconokinase
LIEGVCFGLYSVGEALESVVNPITEITVSGGFTASPLWIQLLADIFQKPMILHQDEDASGCCFAGMACFGKNRRMAV